MVGSSSRPSLHSDRTVILRIMLYFKQLLFPCSQNPWLEFLASVCLSDYSVFVLGPSFNAALPSELPLMALVTLPLTCQFSQTLQLELRSWRHTCDPSVCTWPGTGPRTYLSRTRRTGTPGCCRAHACAPSACPSWRRTSHTARRRGSSHLTNKHPNLKLVRPASLVTA